MWGDVLPPALADLAFKMPSAESGIVTMSPVRPRTALAASRGPRRLRWAAGLAAGTTATPFPCCDPPTSRESPP